MLFHGSIAVFAIFGVLQINANPIPDEYGVPFETYGVPPKEELHEIIRPRIDVRFKTPPTEAPIIVPGERIPIEEKDILPFQRIPTTPIAPISLTENLPVNQTPKDIVAPPNSRIMLRDDKNQYSSGFQSPDGTEVKEQGRLISTDNGWEYVIAKTGSYRYISPEGKDVAVEWIADEKGFRILKSTV